MLRITPAYAGKRKMEKLGVKTYEDHPRLCGEKSSKRHDGVIPPGSPPPMRGKVVLSAAFAAGVGITPAYAGKSFSIRWGIFFLQDHPRLCGEKLYKGLYKHAI